MKTVDEVSEFITSYWRNPDPAAALDALKVLTVGGYFKKTRKVGGPLAFFAAVATKDPKAGEAFYAIAVANNIDLPRLADIRSRMQKMDAGTAADLDVLWAFYFATGDLRFVDRVIAVSRGTDAVLVATASWSLRSIGQIHPEVLERLNR